MTLFVVGVALGCCTAALLPAGIAHLLRPAQFAQLVAAHGVLRPRSAPAVAVAVGVTETVVGGGALVAIVADGLRRPVLGAALLLGIAFVTYLTALMRRPHAGLGCGCTPLAGPVTTASLLPGAVLVAVSVPALPAAGAPAGAAWSGPVWFGAVCGATLAVAVMLVPATVPDPEPTPEPRRA